MKDIKELNFEKALAELEKIVEKLEEGNLSLDQSLSLFEEGVKLARFLRSELEKAEKKVETLLKEESGEIKQVPFDASQRDRLKENGEKEGKEETNREDEDIPF